MLIRRHAKTGQRTEILFVSDLDPSGLDLQRSWEDAMRNFGAPLHSSIVRIGLTHAQVAAIPDSDRMALEVKPSDSRAEKFIEAHGDRCWETDVLPAATIEAAIDARINGWLDLTL